MPSRGNSLILYQVCTNFKETVIFTIWKSALEQDGYQSVYNELQRMLNISVKTTFKTCAGYSEIRKSVIFQRSDSILYNLMQGHTFTINNLYFIGVLSVDSRDYRFNQVTNKEQFRVNLGRISGIVCSHVNKQFGPEVWYLGSKLNV